MYVVDTALLLAFPTGLLAGFIGTLLGIGGGSIMTPVLVLLGVDIKVAAPASLVAIFGTSLGGLRRLFSEGLVKLKLALFLETASITGALVGVYLFEALPSRTLRLILATQLLVSAPLIYKRKKNFEDTSDLESVNKPISTIRYFFAWLGALCAGSLSALLGVGGGLVKVPLMIIVLGLHAKTAISTSKLMVGITALTGVIGHGIEGNIDWALGLALLAGTYIGASLSTRVLLRMEERKLRLIASSYYVLMGIYITINTIWD